MIGPYTESQWQTDRGAITTGGRLACPDCGHDRNFAPLIRRGSGLLEIHLRGCRVCGFWQVADGQSAPYRCRMSVHLCLGTFSTQRDCGGCGNAMPAGLSYHLCPRVLEPDEARECPECHARVGTSHIVPWAVIRP